MFLIRDDKTGRKIKSGRGMGCRLGGRNGGTDPVYVLSRDIPSLREHEPLRFY